MKKKTDDIILKKSGRRAAETVALLGVIAAFAAILSYVETLIPFSLWIPGVKLGLANIAVVIALYTYGAKEALLVNIVRILVVGLLFGNMFSILFSLSGALISLICMLLAKKTDFFTVIGVSVAGGVAHNMGQMLVAALIIDSYNILYYMPMLIIAGIITGFLIGIVGGLIIQYMELIMKKIS